MALERETWVLNTATALGRGEGGGGEVDPCYVDHPAEAATDAQQGNCYLEIDWGTKDVQVSISHEVGMRCCPSCCM